MELLFSMEVCNSHLNHHQSQSAQIINHHSLPTLVSRKALSASPAMLCKTDQTLIMTGERERLKELLRTRLIECGWRDQVQMLCRDVVRERGVHNLKADDLIAEITSKGRALVPDSVKKELLQKIKAYLVQDM